MAEFRKVGFSGFLSLDSSFFWENRGERARKKQVRRKNWRIIVSFCCVKCGNVTESGELMGFAAKEVGREIYEVGAVGHEGSMFENLNKH